MSQKTLIVVDMQNDFVTGSLGTKEAAAIVPAIRIKIAGYQKNGDRIIFTRDTHDENYLETSEGKHLPVVHCIRGTKGWEIIDELQTEGCRIIDKKTFGYLDWRDVQLKEVELVGVCTDICVVSNALIIKAAYPEMTVTVDASCCAGVTPELHQAALTTMKSCQIQVIGD